MFVTGALLGLSAPGYSINGVAFWWWYAWIGLVPAFWWVSQQTSYKRTALGGFLFGWAYHMVYLEWFPALHPMTWLGFTEWQSFIVVGLTYLIMTSLGGVLIGGLLLVYKIFVSEDPTFFEKARKVPLFKERLKKFWPYIVSRLLGFFLFPLLWFGAFRWFGVFQLWIPWPLLEYTQIGLWIVRNISVCKLFGMSFSPSSMFYFLILWNHMLVVLFVRHWKGERGIWRRVFVLLCLMPVLLGLMNYIAELQMPSHRMVHNLSQSPIAIIQGNLPINIVRNDQTLWPYAKATYFDNIARLNFKPDTLLVLPEEGIIPGWVNVDSP